MQALFASASYAPGTRDLDTKPGMASGVWQMRPESRGHVLARTADPYDQPSINPNYLAEDRDRRTLLAGIRLVRAWFGAPALRRYLVAETLPGPTSSRMTSCWPMRGRTAPRCSTPAAPAAWGRTRWRWWTTSCGCMGCRGCG